MTTTTSHARETASLVLPGWVALLSPPIFVRASVVALILGSVLTVLNQPEAIFGASALDLLPIALVYLTPFVVVTLSQILGIRQALRDAKPLRSGERFLATVFAHGIPTKAVLTGVVVGTVNTAITLSEALIVTGSLGEIPVTLLAQAFTLPVLFGLLSQAISYRRAAARFAQTRA